MRRFLYLLLLFPTTLYSAACDVNALVDDCSMNAVSVQYRWLGIGLCKGSPTIPTVNTALDYSNCELVYDQIDADGRFIEWDGKGSYGELTENLVVPPNGTYNYFIFGIGTDMRMKFEAELSVPVKTYGEAHAVSSGRYCRTIDAERVNSDGVKQPALECSSSFAPAVYTSYEIWEPGGVASCDKWDGYYIKSDKTLALAAQDSGVYVAISPITPITISDQTTLLELMWDYSELFVVDIDAESEPSGWFLPYQQCPSWSVSAQ